MPSRNRGPAHMEREARVREVALETGMNYSDCRRYLKAGGWIVRTAIHLAEVDYLREHKRDPMDLQQWAIHKQIIPYRIGEYNDDGTPPVMCTVEVISFPWWDGDVVKCFIRLTPGDPMSMIAVQWPGTCLSDLRRPGTARLIDVKFTFYKR